MLLTMRCATRRVLAWTGSLFMVGGLLSAPACTEVGDPRLMAEPIEVDPEDLVPDGPLSFAEHILPILQEAGCAGCHGAGGGTAGLDTTSAEGLQAGGGQGPGIVPCDHEASLVWRRVDRAEMPAVGPALDDVEVLTIARWIDQGGQATYQPGLCPDAPLD